VPNISIAQLCEFLDRVELDANLLHMGMPDMVLGESNSSIIVAEYGCTPINFGHVYVQVRLETKAIKQLA
jgi:hypothetical protein